MVFDGNLKEINMEHALDPATRDLYALYCFQYLNCGFFDSKKKKQIISKMQELEEKYPSLLNGVKNSEAGAEEND
jgi:hypothetical protein